MTSKIAIPCEPNFAIQVVRYVIRVLQTMSKLARKWCDKKGVQT